VRAQVDALIAAALAKLGRIDILIYAAGANIPARAMRVLTPETWDMMLAVNLTGAFDCTRAVLPAMRTAGGGLIVYISSISAHEADASGAAYQAAKRGLAAWRTRRASRRRRTASVLRWYFRGWCARKWSTGVPFRRPKRCWRGRWSPKTWPRPCWRSRASTRAW